MREVAPSPSEAEVPTAQDAVSRYGLWIKRTALHMVNLMPWAEVEELVQWGIVGLLEARERFDPSRGTPFAAFAERRVRGAMLDSLRRDGNQARRLNKASDIIMNNTLGQSEAYADPLEGLLQYADQTAIAEAIATLPERQQLILQLFFVEELNNREIARVLNVSEAYISQTRRRALRNVVDRLGGDDRLQRGS